MDLIQLINKYPNQESCLRYLEEKRWGNEIKCPYCQGIKTKRVKNERRHKCYICNRSFSVLVGTIFEATKLPLQKWFIAVYLIVDAKKGISSLQLSRHLKVNKDTALLLQRRIRKAMRESHILDGIVEIDETYVGGSMIKMSKKIKDEKGYYPGGMNHKTLVLGMYQREGKLILNVLEKAWSKEIRPIMDMQINPNSIIVSDGFGAYRHSKNVFSNHYSMNHIKHKYKEGIYNTSTIEGFWAMLKRAVIGTYHHISVKHLQEYMDEIAFKFNYRKHPDPFETIINKAFEKFLPFAG